MITTWQAPTVLPVDYHYQINISNGSVLIINTTVDPVYTMNITSFSNTNYTVSVSVVDIGYTHLHSEYTTSTAEYYVYEGMCIPCEVYYIFQFTFLFLELEIKLIKNIHSANIIFIHRQQ